MMTYCLVYDKTQVIGDTGGLTKIIGPFKTFQAASAWWQKNTPEEEAVIDAIYTPSEE